MKKVNKVDSNFQNGLYKGMHCQLIRVELKPREEVGMETHMTVDQFFKVEKGNCKMIIGGKDYDVFKGDVVIIPMGVSHNVVNTSAIEKLELYTLYILPTHKEVVVRATQLQAEYDSPKLWYYNKVNYQAN